MVLQKTLVVVLLGLSVSTMIDACCYPGLPETNASCSDLITEVRDLIHTLKDQHSEQKKKGFDFSSTLSIMVLGLTFTVPEIVIRIIIELARRLHRYLPCLELLQDLLFPDEESQENEQES